VVSSLPALFASAGLVDIGVADESIISGDSPQAEMFETSWEAFDAVLSSHGVLTDHEVALRAAAHRDSTFAFTAGAVYAWGRHP